MSYRDPEQPDQLLFPTANGIETEMKHALSWGKELLVGYCSPEEIIGMSAKAFRKGFSNWARQHPEEAVQINAFSVQDYSENVQMTNYNVASKQIARNANSKEKKC